MISSQTPHKIGSAKYFLIVAIEGAIDMCNHVIALNKLRAPDDYADSFRVLGELGMFPETFMKKLVEMAHFRNRLVHIYWEVDDKVIHNILTDDIDDIEHFINHFTQFITK